jgi:RNA polymerase sigma factor (sigma-70 family)
VSDGDLIKSAQEGDQGAWETLMRTHQEAVFRLAFLMLGSADEAEDVAQETFIRAFGALGRFDRERPIGPWLLSIAANLARNRRRSIGRYLAALRRTFVVEPSVQETIDERSSEAWESQTLGQALRRLSATDREVIYLRYFLDLSEAEAAAALQIAVGTVKSRLSRALARLRALIDREFPALREERQP